jgi:hypothetical protein
MAYECAGNAIPKDQMNVENILATKPMKNS